MHRNLTKSISLVTLASLLLIACGTKQDVAPTAKTDHSPDQVKAMTKYDPPIELSTVRANETLIKFQPGESMDKNAVYDAYAKDLGIQLKNQWVVDGNQYDTKVDMSIASGDIPDFFEVNPLQLKKLEDAGLLMDLTDLFSKDVSSNAQKFFTVDRQINSSKYNGKIMAIPFTDAPTNSSNYIWIRQDWLDKLHLQAPKTMQDVLKISEEFTKENPGGADKSYGLAADKNLYDSAYGLTGFFNGYHAYPGIWLKDASGKLVYGSIQPEMKTALKQLQDIYKAGQIDPEFAVKDTDKENELVTANKIGMAYGLFWLCSWPLKQAAIKDGKLLQNWAVYPIVSNDAKPAMTQVGLGVNNYYVISKKCKNPEAVFELLNKVADYQMNRNDSNKVYRDGPNGDPTQQFVKANPMTLYLPDLNIKSGEVLPNALKTGDTSKLADIQDAQQLYDESKKYLNGETKYWNSWMKSKEGGSLQWMSQYAKDNRYLADEFYGTPTPTMGQKGSTLQSKEQEVFIKIITNQAPIEAFDQFVTDWKNLGGDAITKEVNDWYTQQNKR